MKFFRIIAFAFLLALPGVAAAQPQSAPNWSYGYTPTPAEWQYWWSHKVDYQGSVPCPIGGCTMTGPLITVPSTTAAAGFNIPSGAAPTSPNNGDLWETAAGVFAQVNGVTYNLVTGTCGTCAQTNVANVFTATPQLVQGLTTTQPSWQAKITGDAQARISFGLNSTDIGSLQFGPGSGARDTFLERSAAATFRFGAPDAASPVAQTLGMQNVVAGTSNTAGPTLTVNGSRGTGNAGGGDVVIQVAPAGSSGSTQNALTNALHIYGLDGGVTIGSPTGADEGAFTLNLQGSLYNNGAAPTGTLGYVRASSPTFQASIGINGTSPGGSEVVLNALDASMVATNNILIAVGRDGSTADRCQIGFYYAGLNSVNNHGWVGCFGSDHTLNWDGNANVGIQTGNNVLDKAFTIVNDSTFFVDGSGNESLGGSVTSAGTNSSFGPGGATAGNSFFNLNGSSTSNGGSLIAYKKNGTTNWYLGDNSAVFGSSSSDWMVYNNSLPATALDISFSTNVATFGASVITAGYAIASLPTCNSGLKGARAYVTNAQTTPTFLGTVSTTGAVVAPVFCNGAGWLYGQLEPANDNIPHRFAMGTSVPDVGLLEAAA